MTLEAAAELAGMTAGNISAMERGAQGYSQAGLEALAGVYECDPGQLITEPPTSDAQNRAVGETLERQFCPTFIPQWREYRNLTLDQLADRIGMTQSHLSMLERGQRGYAQNTLEAIADALQCDAGQLLTVDPTNNDQRIDFVPARGLLPTFIRQWRKHRGKTLEQLGEAVDLSHAQLGRIERGLQPYNQWVLEAIAEALGTDPATLLSRDPSDREAIWSIWDKAQSFERELIVNVATAILNTRKGD